MPVPRKPRLPKNHIRVIRAKIEKEIVYEGPERRSVKPERRWRNIEKWGDRRSVTYRTPNTSDVARFPPLVWSMVNFLFEKTTHRLKRRILRDGSFGDPSWRPEKDIWEGKDPIACISDLKTSKRRSFNTSCTMGRPNACTLRVTAEIIPIAGMSQIKRRLGLGALQRKPFEFFFKNTMHLFRTFLER